MSILFNSPPDEKIFTKGLMILSCSEDNAIRMMDFAKKHGSWIDWTILYRYDSGNVFKGEKLMLSSDADTVLKMFRMVVSIRGERFDIVYVAWTNEPSYGFLKILGLLSNFSYLRIFDENLETFYFVRKYFGNWQRHLLRRWKTRPSLRYLLMNTLSWIFLFPVGMVYLFFQTFRYLIRSARNKNERSSRVRF